MDLSTLTPSLLSALGLYGLPILAVTILAGASGLPFPSTTLLLAAGALARIGGLDPFQIVLVALLAALVGDGAGFLVGKYLCDKLPQRIVNHPQWGAASERFARQGWGALYLSRWLLTPISVPLNVLAGASGYRTFSFLTAEIAGDLTWVLLYGGAGYLLGTQWEVASAFVGSYGTTVALWALAAVALWYIGTSVRRRTDIPKHPPQLCTPVQTLAPQPDRM